ncbi:MAG: oligosaccharide flippase family protein [Flavobacteriales bacterium]
MISKKTIYGSFLYTAVGAMPFASALILLPFYSNYLSTNDFGALSVYIGFSLFVQVISTFSIEQYVATHVSHYADQEELLKQRMSQALTLCLGAGLLVFGLFYVTGQEIFRLFDKEGQLDFALYGMMSVGTGIFNGYFRNYTNLLVYRKQDRLYISSNTFNFVITIILSLGFLNYYGSSLMGPMMGRIVSGALIFSLALFHQIKNYNFVWNNEAVKEVLFFAGPLLLISIFNWSTNYIDRFLLTSEVSLDEVGIYDFATKFLLPVELLHIGLSNYVMPRIYSSWNKNFTQPNMVNANQMLHSFLVLTVAAIIVTLVAIPLGVPLLVKNKDFYQAFAMIPLLSIGYLTRAAYNLFSGILMLQKAIKRFIIAFMVAAVFQIGSSLIVLPVFGIHGAVVISAATKIVLVVSLYFSLKNIAQLDLRTKKFLWYPVLISIALIAYQFFAKEHYWIALFVFVVYSAIVTYAIFGKELVKLAEAYIKPKER